MASLPLSLAPSLSLSCRQAFEHEELDYRKKNCDLEAIRERANQQLGKGQRLSGLERRDELPRSTIGKILKRELRDPYWKDLEQSKRD